MTSGYKVPSRMVAVVTISRMLLIRMSDSRDIGDVTKVERTEGARQAYNPRDKPTTRDKKIRIKTPRAGSLAKACTEVRIPERTRKVPSSDNENATSAKSTVQALNTPRFSVAASECTRAVPTSHGIKDAFSTGSQNHQPPQPSSLYAHQLPRAIPMVKKLQANRVHGLDQRAHAPSRRPARRAAMPNAKGTEKPT